MRIIGRKWMIGTNVSRLIVVIRRMTTRPVQVRQVWRARQTQCGVVSLLGAEAQMIADCPRYDERSGRQIGRIGHIGKRKDSENDRRRLHLD